MLLLNDHESPYVNYLLQKKVQIDELKTVITPQNQTVRDQVQAGMHLNKEVLDKAQEAFVSYLRYYKEHQLQFIFNMI